MKCVWLAVFFLTNHTTGEKSKQWLKKTKKQNMNWQLLTISFGNENFPCFLQGKCSAFFQLVQDADGLFHQNFAGAGRKAALIGTVSTPTKGFLGWYIAENGALRELSCRAAFRFL